MQTETRVAERLERVALVNPMQSICVSSNSHWCTYPFSNDFYDFMLEPGGFELDHIRLVA